MYTLDTNILIRLSRQLPRDIFAGPWDALEELIEDGRACICDPVLIEVSRGGDDLYRWAKGLDGFKCDIHPSEPPIVQQIGAAHPDWVRGTQNEADPWLIAHAIAHQRTIVTDETLKGPGVADHNQKVPNIAAEHNVPVLDFFNFARAEHWVFR